MARYCVGQAMAVEWGDEPKPEDMGRLARRALRYVLPYWRRALLALACLAVGAVLGLAPAFLAKELIDQLAATDAQYSAIAVLVVATIGAAIVAALIGVVQAYLGSTLSQTIMFDLRRQVFERLLDQSVGFYTRSRTGDVMSRINNDVGRIEDVISETVFSVATSALVVVATLGYMFWLDWRLTLVGVSSASLAVIPSRYLGREAFRTRQRTQEKLGEMTAYLQEVLGVSGMLLVKAFARERAERGRFDALNRDVRRLEVRQEMISRWFGLAMRSLSAAGFAALWLYGGYLVIEGAITLATFITIGTVLLIRLYGAIASLGGTNVNIVGSLALFHRLFQIVDLRAEVTDAPSARPLERVRGAVAFECVSFAYDAGRRPALSDVTFEIEPGQLVALVGPSGAGKTTISYLIPRFYDPQAGTVRIDGDDVRERTLETLRQQVGIVFQDTFLFHATLRENLLYVRPDASTDELEAATHAANLDGFIDSLPEGLETLVGERGHRLSGGEKQRVALARVMLRDAPILVLDEATSHLDSISEQLIQESLRPLFASRTSIVIAHRLSTILAADLILVLDRGRIVEQGTHAELLALEGLYAKLYDGQFRPQRAATEIAVS